MAQFLPKFARDTRENMVSSTDMAMDDEPTGVRFTGVTKDDTTTMTREEGQHFRNYLKRGGKDNSAMSKAHVASLTPAKEATPEAKDAAAQRIYDDMHTGAYDYEGKPYDPSKMRPKPDKKTKAAASNVGNWHAGYNDGYAHGKAGYSHGGRPAPKPRRPKPAAPTTTGGG